MQQSSFGLSSGSAAGQVLAAGTPAETILRMRGWCKAWIDGLQAPASAVLVTAGLILVPEGQGSTVIWEPFGDANAPWIWYTSFIIGYEEMVADAIDVPTLSSQSVLIDNKAMRKGSPDEELQLVITNSTLAGAASINSSLSGRILLGH